MTIKLYLVEFESAHFAAPSDYCVVHAHSAEEAKELAEDYANEYCQELYTDEYAEAEGIYDDESAATIVGAEEFTPENEHWKWFKDSTQSQFYPMIN